MKNWIDVTIGDLCEVIAGQSPAGEYYNQENIGLPFYQGKKEFGEKFIGAPQIWTRKTTKEAEGGDILMSVRAPVGPINFAVEKICIGRGLAAIRAGTKIDRNFLFYCLLSKQNEINGNEGAVFASINKKQIESIKFLCPPLSEQKRIVEILDEAFEAIDSAIENTKQNLTNARELFDSYLNAIFTQKGEGWVEQKIEDVCESIVDCINKTAPVIDEPSPFKMIRTTNIRNGFVNLESVKYVTEETYQKWTRRQIPKQGDVLLTREAPMGEVGMLLTEDYVFLGQRIVSYRTDPIKLNNKFLLYAFQSNNLQSQILAFASGSTVQHMRVPDTKMLRIPVPPLSIQKQVIQNLDLLLIQSQRLETIYQQKLAALNELKQSILHKAFTGELTADKGEASSPSEAEMMKDIERETSAV